MFYRSLIQKIKNAKTIFITTHLAPDADGLGSQLALHRAFDKMGKKSFLVNEEKLIGRYLYLDPSKIIQSIDEFLETKDKTKIDLCIIVDTNKIVRTGHKISQYLQSQNEVIFIDHHPFKHQEPDKYYIDQSAAATGQIVGQLLKEMGITFDREIARPLYTAILIDTNSFRYPNVTTQTHSLIAELLSTGINPNEAYNHIYGTKKINNLHLLGKILQECEINQKGNVSWIRISEDAFSKYQSEMEDTHAYINNLLSLDGIRVACMFRDQGNSIKVSLRSHGDIDVAEIASKLGGGGHAHSAAASFEFKNEEDKKNIISATLKTIESMIDNF